MVMLLNWRGQNFIHRGDFSVKIKNQSATLIWSTPNAEQIIECTGRLAYKSEDKVTGDSHANFIKMLLARKHESVLEHASASIHFITNRGISHEIVRHRIASYTQESTRYCNYSKEKFGNEITVIQPFFEKSGDWITSCKAAEAAYLAALAAGEKPQVARDLLPTCLKTELIMTANFREWRHFIRLRIAKDAHPQIQDLAQQTLRILNGVAPNVFPFGGFGE
jgi:thymidylate synthase (FAD)